MVEGRRRRVFGMLAISAAFAVVAIGFGIAPGTKSPGRDSNVVVLPLLGVVAGSVFAIVGIKLLRGTGGRASRVQRVKQTAPIDVRWRDFCWIMADVFPAAELTGEVLFDEMNRATGGCPEKYRVGDLEGFVWGRVRGKTTREISLRPVYYKVRDAIHGVLPVPRRKIRPSAKLDDLFPRQARWAAWGYVHQRLGLEAPPLDLSPGMRWMFVVMSMPLLCVMSALADGLDAWGDGPKLLARVLGMVMVGLLCAGMYAVGRSMRHSGSGTAFPADCGNVRNLVIKLSKPLGEVMAWEEAMVQLRIRRLVGTVRGIMVKDVSPDASLVGDVGIVMKE